MNFTRNVCLVVFLCAVVSTVALDINDVGHADTASTSAPKIQSGEEKKERFIDFDEIFSSLTNGMNFSVSQSQGSSFVKKVTQSHGTLGGQTVMKTEITEITGNNPGLRFKRGLFDDLMDDVESKGDFVKNKLTGVVADGVNLAYSGYNKVKNAIKQ